jgi:hypothetical protein
MALHFEKKTKEGYEKFTETFRFPGEHPVHKEGCSPMPSESNCQYLGFFLDCHKAVKEAERYYDEVDGCCCNEYHMRSLKNIWVKRG